MKAGRQRGHGVGRDDRQEA